jgi:hypothetical protein
MDIVPNGPLGSAKSGARLQEDRKIFPIAQVETFDLQMIMIIIASTGREISR